MNLHVRRLVPALAAAVLIAATPEAYAQDVPLAPGLSVGDSHVAGKYPELNDAWPAPALVFALGELRGMRDIQGGQIVPGYPQLNALSIGAGNGQRPGVLDIGADVSRAVRFHARRPEPARPVPLATMTPRGTTFHAPVRFEGRAAAAFRRLVRREALRMLRAYVARHPGARFDLRGR